MEENIKFYYNGIKVNGELIKCYYSVDLFKKSIHITTLDYKSLPVIGNAKITNNSDMMTDYFENDRTAIDFQNKYFLNVANAAIKFYEKRLTKIEKSEKINMKYYNNQRIQNCNEEIKNINKIIEEYKSTIIYKRLVKIL
jgi:hypothetical protein